MPEVARHEPASALDGGGDGLEAYRALAAALPALLAPGAAPCSSSARASAPRWSRSPAPPASRPSAAAPTSAASTVR